MDSLIHYRANDVTRVLAGLAGRTDQSIVFTFAPRTPVLRVLHAVGKFFPRSDRAPAIEPVSEGTLLSLVGREPGLEGWCPGRSHRISSGFYTSQAMELSRL
jgi:magnesium-protoporphyrin O-methyltransferase